MNDSQKGMDIIRRRESILLNDNAGTLLVLTEQLPCPSALELNLTFISFSG